MYFYITLAAQERLSPQQNEARHNKHHKSDLQHMTGPFETGLAFLPDQGMLIDFTHTHGAFGDLHERNPKLILAAQANRFVFIRYKSGYQHPLYRNQEVGKLTEAEREILGTALQARGLDEKFLDAAWKEKHFGRSLVIGSSKGGSENAAKTRKRIKETIYIPLNNLDTEVPPDCRGLRRTPSRTRYNR